MLLWAGPWQIGYNTIYAYVDVKDGTRLGLKSTAILFGRHGKACVVLLFALATGAWSFGGWLLGMSPPYVIGMLVIAAHLGWQTWKIDLVRPEVNYRLFLANILTGILLASAAFMGTV
ncbi:4-hydroxybenzoate polyprenyltransferase [Phyllobacterium myrsinacearum]|uniref:4-hydroxybenzoate polyprenyltransferase n=1 Tax=Phyllobacterium myrsinacearum TaxID=28101 RepID=A0A839EP82_9HYPH|nr:4-hydroxybenzoate polyprenyltransferase [Phyllobacterium myrsinacearum]